MGVFDRLPTNFTPGDLFQLGLGGRLFPAGSHATANQFLIKDSFGDWVPHTLVAGDIPTLPLSNVGGWALLQKSANYAIQAADVASTNLLIEVTATATITLPVPSTTKGMICIVYASAGTVTVAQHASEVIVRYEGTTVNSLALSKIYDKTLLISDGTNWIELQSPLTDATAPTTSAVGDAAATGSARTLALRDHLHGRESFATNAIVLGTAAAAGAATTPMRSNDTIAAFDATVPTTSAAGDAAATGSAAKAARRDHVHGRETGAWTSVAYASGNFTSSGGSWTVDSGDQGTYAYVLNGKTMTVAFEINTSSVGAGATALLIAIPASKTAARSIANTCWIADGSFANVGGLCDVQGAGTTILIRRSDLGAFTASTNTTYVFGQITFEIQ